jgi:hypothetical protein
MTAPAQSLSAATRISDELAVPPSTKTANFLFLRAE